MDNSRLGNSMKGRRGKRKKKTISPVSSDSTLKARLTQREREGGGGGGGGGWRRGEEGVRERVSRERDRLKERQRKRSGT